MTSARGFANLALLIIVLAAIIGVAAYYAAGKGLISGFSSLATTSPSGAQATSTPHPQALAPASKKVVATSTIGVVVDNNNLFVGGKLVQPNIPAMLSLVPSTLGQVNSPESTNGMYYSDYWPGDKGLGTLDAYTDYATTTDGSIALVYKRQELKNFDDVNWPSTTFATVLIYSNSKLAQRFDLDVEIVGSSYATTIYLINNSYVYISELSGGKEGSPTYLYSISRSTKQTQMIGEVGLLSPDETQMAFSSAPAGYELIGPCAMGGGTDNEVDAVDLRTARTTRLTSDPTRPHTPLSWSADSRYLFIADGVTEPGSTCTDHFTTFFIHDTQKSVRIIPPDASLKAGYPKACEQYRCTRADVSYLAQSEY